MSKASSESKPLGNRVKRVSITTLMALKTFVKFHGIPVVPDNGFGEFEGVVITSNSIHYFQISLYKTVRRNGGYYIDCSLDIPFEETLEYSLASGKEKLDFLCSKAKEFSPGSNIAITEDLRRHLSLMDCFYEELQEILESRK